MLLKNRIWLSPPTMTGREREFVNKAFQTNWVAPAGPNIDGFEEDLCIHTGSKYAVALSSGTAAIHLSLLVLGVKPGDEVMCSSFTFAGSANPIAYVGASPVFIDSEHETWNMDPELLEKAILERKRKKKKIGAIILVHLYGMPARINKIKSIASNFGIPLIEDAAEALGSKYKDKQVGTFSEVGILSFNGNKIITTSGGGAIISNRKLLAGKIKFLSTQARDKALHYEHSEIGYNYRLSNVCAGIGRGQLTGLKTFITKRRKIFERYKEALSPYGFQFPKEPESFFSNRWLTTLICKNKSQRNRIINSLDKLNIETRPLWKPMHLQPVFKSCLFIGNNISGPLFDKGLCLPSGSSLSEEDQSFIIDQIIKNL